MPNVRHGATPDLGAATTPEQLAAALRRRRLELKLSQAELARRVGSVQRTISELENDPERRSLGTLFRVLSVLELELGVNRRPAGALSDDPDLW